MDITTYSFPVCILILYYLQIIDTPIDLSIIKKKLNNKKYGSKGAFINDMRAMFRNSRKYNTDKTLKVSRHFFKNLFNFYGIAARHFSFSYASDLKS